MIFVFGSLYSIYSVIRHLKFETYSFDLGIYDQIIWLASRGKPLFSSLLEVHPWADHFTPTLLLLAPLYWLWDNVIILLVFQAFFACFGAFPIYLLAKKKLKNDLTSLMIAFAYLSFFGIQNAIAFDFHPIMLATTFFAYVLWFYEQKKWTWFWVCILLILGLQENFFLLLAAYGVFLVVRFGDWKRGAILTLGCLSFFWILITKIMPGFGQAFIYMPSHLAEIGGKGIMGGVVEIARMIVYPESKQEVVFFSLLSFGFLPLLSPASWILLAEECLQRFVGTPISTRWQLGYQYNCILAPVLAWGAIEGAKRIQGLLGVIWTRGITGILVAVVGAGIVITQIQVLPAGNDLLDKKFYDLSRTNDAREVLGQIPFAASVGALNNYGPQLSHREGIYLLANCVENPDTWGLDMKRCYSSQPDYLVADLGDKGNWNDFYPDYDPDSIRRLFDYLLAKGEYKMAYEKGSVVLIQKTTK